MKIGKMPKIKHVSRRSGRQQTKLAVKKVDVSIYSNFLYFVNCVFVSSASFCCCHLILYSVKCLCLFQVQFVGVIY